MSIKKAPDRNRGEIASGSSAGAAMDIATVAVSRTRRGAALLWRPTRRPAARARPRPDTYRRGEALIARHRHRRGLPCTRARVLPETPVGGCGRAGLNLWGRHRRPARHGIQDRPKELMAAAVAGPRPAGGGLRRWDDPDPASWQGAEDIGFPVLVKGPRRRARGMRIVASADARSTARSAAPPRGRVRLGKDSFLEVWGSPGISKSRYSATGPGPWCIV